MQVHGQCRHSHRLDFDNRITAPLLVHYLLGQQAVVLAAGADRQRPLPAGLQLGDHHLGGEAGRGGEPGGMLGSKAAWQRHCAQSAQLHPTQAGGLFVPRMRFPHPPSRLTVILRGPLVPSTLVWYMAAPSSHRPPGLPALGSNIDQRQQIGLCPRLACLAHSSLLTTCHYPPASEAACRTTHPVCARPAHPPAARLSPASWNTNSVPRKLERSLPTYEAEWLDMSCWSTCGVVGDGSLLEQGRRGARRHGIAQGNWKCSTMHNPTAASVIVYCTTLQTP